MSTHAFTRGNGFGASTQAMLEDDGSVTLRLWLGSEISRGRARDLKHAEAASAEFLNGSDARSLARALAMLEGGAAEVPF